MLTASTSFLGPLVDCKVAAVNLSPLDTYTYPAEVAWEIDQNNDKEYVQLAQTFSNDDTISGVIIQHEYGIFGGVDGEKVLSFMKVCTKPMLITLHTVLPKPSAHMHDVTNKIIQFASTIIVLTQNSKEIVEKVYPQSLGKVFVIPHGIHTSTFSEPKKYKEKLELENYIVVSTFGLLNRGKGIEYAIKTLPKVIKKYPTLLYLILGETHPVVRRNEGEKYRLELENLVTKLGLEKHVRFYDQYLSLPDLLEFLKATDIYIAMSTNPNQAVSGTLSYALGAGRAAISTEFAQAKEIITPDTGRLVPIKNSDALTRALLDLLSDEKRLKKMHRNAYVATRPMLWNNVAEKYSSLLARTVIPYMKLTHLQHMTDDFGIFQFAGLSTPNKDFGYTLDDNARALIFCSWQSQIAYTKELEALIVIYLSFIQKCQQKDGSFVNYIGFIDKAPTVQNTSEDLEDTQSRALWALGVIMHNKTLSPVIRKKAQDMFLLTFSKNTKLTHLRARAFAIKALALVLDSIPQKRAKLLMQVKEHADALLVALTTHSIKSWRWFEDDLNYNNALLSESLLIAGDILKNDNYTKKGILSLEFLIGKTFSKTYMPIGHAKWYKNNEKRSKFDQQPEDPASMILALSSAYKYTREIEYKKLANICFSWFLGNNSLKIALYDYDNGGCYDGLHADRVNLNQGAESLVSYLMSSFMIKQLN